MKFVLIISIAVSALCLVASFGPASAAPDCRQLADVCPDCTTRCVAGEG